MGDLGVSTIDKLFIVTDDLGKCRMEMVIMGSVSHLFAKLIWESKG